MDYDGDVIRVVKGCCGPVECGVIEVPFRGSNLPDELRKLAPVFIVARPPAFCRKVVLVPPLELRLWRQRHLAGFRAADQIAAHRHQGLAALRPERRDDAGSPRSPIAAGEDRTLDLERLQSKR